MVWRKLILHKEKRERCSAVTFHTIQHHHYRNLTRLLFSTYWTSYDQMQSEGKSCSMIPLWTSPLTLKKHRIKPCPKQNQRDMATVSQPPSIPLLFYALESRVGVWKSWHLLIQRGDLYTSFQEVFMSIEAHWVPAALKEVLRNTLDGMQERMEIVFPHR